MKLDKRSTSTRKIIDFRKFGFRDMQVLGRYNYNKVEKNLPDHAHKGMIEICYYDKGTQHFEVNNKYFVVRGGDVFINYPGEIHGSGSYPEEKGVLYWLIIKLDGKTTTDLVYLCKRLIEKKKRHFRGTKRIKWLMEGLLQDYNRKEDPL
jgi:hypothetical protein